MSNAESSAANLRDIEPGSIPPETIKPGRGIPATTRDGEIPPIVKDGRGVSGGPVTRDGEIPPPVKDGRGL